MSDQVTVIVTTELKKETIMSEKIIITKIALSTEEGVKVELSLKEAKDLYDQLDKLFGQKFAGSFPIGRTMGLGQSPFSDAQQRAAAAINRTNS